MQKTQRLYWGNQNFELPPLNLTKIQLDSWKWFLETGIAESLIEIVPIEDFTGKNWHLELSGHVIEKPTITPGQAMHKGLTYASALRVTAKLTNKQTNKTTTGEVFLGDVPQMTDRGTFIVNGVERTVINQIIRSPGVYFGAELDAPSGRMLHTAEMRPIRGTWLEFEMSRSDVISVRIDRRRKFVVTTLLRAMGLNNDEMLGLFADADIDPDHKYIESTLAKDNTKTTEEALIEIYKKMRPGEPIVLENAQKLIFDLFFNPRRYDLGAVGRYKTNRRIGASSDQRILSRDDLVLIVKYVIGLQNGHGKTDDIDHLSNRRIRRVGELVAQTAFREGLLRLERAIREKMSLVSTEELVTPASLVNARPVIAAINQFFRSSQLSQILEQTNPLSEIEILRRLTVFGPNGLTRERASFSIRDINSSQYSRIDPVRSPEGPNIGLVTYLALYARVNEFGFLEAPYRKVIKETVGGKTKLRLGEEVVYMSADDEEQYHISHADLQIDDKGYVLDEWLPMRFKGNFMEGSADLVEYVDIVPRQVVGTSASLIPFLANDAANRALMGANMQCQAVPLLKPQSPIVGTGMEKEIPSSMGWTVHARHSGTVTAVDATKIVIKLDKKPAASDITTENLVQKGDTETYYLTKFKRTAQSTCYNQRPAVTVGQKISVGQLLIDGPACEDGELALGQNMVIAYGSYNGLGYEDAIVISEKLVTQDMLTSIHIEEHEADVVDTKLGPEELTRDIPNVGENYLANLDSQGIVTVGSEVSPNDILVGKIAPKGETELSAEERLLRAIFGEKARDVRDTSLRMPHGERGIVVDVQILSRSANDELPPGVNERVIVKIAQIRKITVGDKLAGRHGNKGVISKIVPVADMPYLPDGTPVDIMISPLSVLARMNLGQLLEARLGWAMDKQGKKVAVPVFEKVSEEKIVEEMNRAGLPITGKVTLIDGRTGLPNSEPTVVGMGYILKLSHMVEDKTHARSTGPYSLVTQQPLGGKAQMGGQRLGEMEVWALEAHKAAHTLQEMLTIKSDDVVGRAKAFEAIVKGTDIPSSSVPESFNVLVKELQSLGLQIIPQGVQLKAATDDTTPTAAITNLAVSMSDVEVIESKKEEDHGTN
jgi:DNA-directed RNA polymerase subunit beta